MNHSPQEAGDSNLAKVEAHFAKLRAEGKSLPMRGSRVNIDQLAKDCELKNRNPFYTNKAIKAALAAFVQKDICVDVEQSQRELQEVRSRLLKLEQRTAALVAENDALKAQNKELQESMDRMKTEEEIMLSGRRVIL
jgi:hypothetical protein